MENQRELRQLLLRESFSEVGYTDELESLLERKNSLAEGDTSEGMGDSVSGYNDILSLCHFC